MERAKAFYTGKLGLKLLSENPGGAIIEAGGGSTLLLFPRAEATKAEHTVAGFYVADVPAEVAELRAQGVVFPARSRPGPQPGHPPPPPGPPPASSQPT